MPFDCLPHGYWWLPGSLFDDAWTECTWLSLSSVVTVGQTGKVAVAVLKCYYRCNSLPAVARSGMDAINRSMQKDGDL